MNFCNYCRSFKKFDGENKNLCTRFIDENGNYARVSVCGVCNYFDRRLTLEEVGYREDGFYFLVQAYAEYAGKDDYDSTLTILNRFRGFYVTSTERGKQLLKEYRIIVPKIIEKINSSKKKQLYYEYIRETINKVADFAGYGAHERALNEYNAMIDSLKNKLKLQ